MVPRNCVLRPQHARKPPRARKHCSHYQNSSEWEQRATDAGLQLEQKPLLPDGIMNGRLEWQEVRRVLRAFASGKAADTAGWSAELACAALRDEHGVIHAEAEASARVGDVPDASVMAPPTAFARSLFSVLAIIFETREIPTDAAQALCVSIPKAGGDSSKLSDDRGIQIMPLLIKILTTVVKSRVEAALATRPAGDRTPRREQAGFMPREEAVGQAAALIELLRRRQRQRRICRRRERGCELQWPARSRCDPLERRCRRG